MIPHSSIQQNFTVGKLLFPYSRTNKESQDLEAVKDLGEELVHLSNFTLERITASQ